MKNKLIFTFALAILALFTASFAAAVVPNHAPYAGGIGYGYASYGSHPVNQYYGGYYPAYETQPVRAGGWFGANSAFLIGLKPGYYDSPNLNYYNRNRISSSYYAKGPYGYAMTTPRAGGWFGQSHTYNLRGSSYVYGGAKNYAVPNYYFSGPM